MSKIRALIKHFIIIVFGLFLLYPLLWMISASFKPEAEIFVGVSFLPTRVTFENYIIGWRGIGGFTFGHFFLNSLIISIANVIGHVLTCSMAAYAFAKLKFKLNRPLFIIMLLTLMLPFHVRLIPQYIIFHNIGWVNTFLPLIVPSFFATGGFFIFLLVQFMRNISDELLEAPRIDGCGSFRLYVYIVMPLSVPALVTVAIFGFIWSWNDFFAQMIYLMNPARFTVTLALRNFVDPTGQSLFGSLFAMSILSLVPLFTLFIIFQKYLIEGIAAGAVKG